MVYACLTVLLQFVQTACNTPEPGASAPAHISASAVYHWKSHCQLGPDEQSYLEELAIDKLYVRFFDVDWDSRQRRISPKAIVSIESVIEQPVVPVVFITNTALASAGPAAMPALADDIARLVDQIAEAADIAPVELQIDCDWTASTRTAYFRLLVELRRRVHLPLSATIRLHQVKYTRQTGIPPVDRGMLMLYNVGDWRDPSTDNSIYTPEAVEPYLSYLSIYPLPLDVVLPAFSWAVVYRNDRFLRFVNNVSLTQLQATDLLTPGADPNRFFVAADTFAFGLRLRPGDLIRFEAVHMEALRTLRDRALGRLAGDSITLALYHLDSAELSVYPRRDLYGLLHATPP